MIAGFHGTRQYERDHVTGTVSLTDPDGQTAVDANPANGQVSVDMGITAPGAAVALNAVIPRILTHGRPATFFYGVANTGGQDLIDIRLSDDRCPNPTVHNTAMLPAGYSPPTSAGATCAYTSTAPGKSDPRAAERGRPRRPLAAWALSSSPPRRSRARPTCRPTT